MSSANPWYIRARLKTRQLMLLIAIDEEGNIHRAAETLCMSQPAASKLLKDLEDMVAVPLFERLPRGMRPTWYGESMIRHARIALASLHEAGIELEALKAGRFGSVRVGTIASPSTTLLPAALATVTQQYPDLRVSVLVESSDVLQERLAQNKLDILVARLFERHDKTHLHYEALAEEQICGIVRPQHPLLQMDSLSLKKLAAAAWIVPPPGSVLRHRFELMFQESGHEMPSCLIESTDVVFITRMLECSDYIAVVATDVARYYADYGMVEILPIELSCNMDAFGLITRTDWLLSPGAKIMLEALKTAAVSLYGVELKMDEAT